MRIPKQKIDRAKFKIEEKNFEQKATKAGKVLAARQIDTSGLPI
jgi:hypothetical protein